MGRKTIEQLERPEVEGRFAWTESIASRVKNSVEFFRLALFKPFKITPVAVVEKRKHVVKDKLEWFMAMLDREKLHADTIRGTDQDPFLGKVPDAFKDIVAQKDLILMSRLSDICVEKGLTPPKSVLSLFLEGIKCIGECDVDELWPWRKDTDPRPGEPKPNLHRFRDARDSELPEDDSAEVLKQRLEETEVEPLLKFKRCSGPTELDDPANEGSCLWS